MEDKVSQQMKKGVLEMLVLKLICSRPAHGYQLLLRLKEESYGRISLKEGTLYPILYRLEDDGFIEAIWHQGEGRAAPKKVYRATEAGRAESVRRMQVWLTFVETVNGFYQGGTEHE